MKKTSLIFSIILMLFLLTNAVFAEETAILGDTAVLNETVDPTEGADSDGFVITDGVLSKYVGESSDPIVPQTVTLIAGGAFTHTDNLKSVTVAVECEAEVGAFPDGITVYGFSTSKVHMIATMANCKFVDITPEKVTITVTYTHDFGAPAAATYTQQLSPGESYRIPSPELDGFVSDISVVEGVAGRVNKTISVTYKKNTTDGWRITHNTIKYYENGAPVCNDSRTIDGVNYTFNQVGNVELSGRTLTIGTDTYYLENSLITTGYKVIGQGLYFFTKEGPMVKATVYDGHEFDINGTMIGHDVAVDVSGSTYYLVNNLLFTGYRFINDQIVYFGKDYKMIKSTTLNSLTFDDNGYITGGIDAKNLTVSTIAPVSHTGKPIKPAITVSFENLELTENVHYTVTYRNNTDIGRATVTVKGKGPISGTTDINFDILGEKVYTLTIKYLTDTGTTIVSEYITALEKGEKYSIPSPDIEGYSPDVETVTGTMGEKDVEVTVIYEKIENTVENTEETTADPVETVPVGPGYANPDSMFKETESEHTTKTESTKETTAKETVETIFHKVVEKNVIYNYELLAKVIVIDTLVCGVLVVLVLKWKSIKNAVTNKFSKRKKGTDKTK